MNKVIDNSRNGHCTKPLRTSFRIVEMSVSQDCKGEFKPQVMKKNQTDISQDIEEIIQFMHTEGITTVDI